MHDFMKKSLPNCNIFAITGGEPLIFPKVVEEILTVFKGTHVKISTNALKLDQHYLDLFKEHGNVSLCISLDGPTFAANKTRYPNQETFELVVKNIERALAAGFLVEISCVLNKNSMGEFPAFSEWIDRTWGAYLQQLVLIAYPITTYTRKPGPEKDYLYDAAQAAQVASYIRAHVDDRKILQQTKEYFLDLASFFEGTLKKKRVCQKYSWCLTVEYVNFALWTSGNVLSYGCGTKGDKSLGIFNLDEQVDQSLLAERKADPLLTEYFQDGKGRCCFDCFTNWHMIDMFYAEKLKDSLPLWSDVYTHKNHSVKPQNRGAGKALTK